MQTKRQNRRFCGTRGGRQMNKSLFKNHQTPTAAALGFLRHQGGESRSKGLRRKRGTRRGTVQLHHPVPHGAGTERQLVLFHLRAARGAIRAGTNSRKSAANNLTPPSKYPHSLRAVIWVGARRSKLDVFFVPGATLKVFATGNGSTKKLALAQPAQYAADAETGLLRRNGRPLDVTRWMQSGWRAILRRWIAVRRIFWACINRKLREKRNGGPDGRWRRRRERRVTRFGRTKRKPSVRR